MRQQPPNREIGFVSYSFLFRVVRASGRGEAAWAQEGRHPERWASRELGSLGRRASRVFDFLLTGVRVLRDFGLFLLARGRETADRRSGFKDFGSCDISFRQHLMRVLRIFDVCMVQITVSNTLCGF